MATVIFRLATVVGIFLLFVNAFPIISSIADMEPCVFRQLSLNLANFNGLLNLLILLLDLDLLVLAFLDMLMILRFLNLLIWNQNLGPKYLLHANSSSALSCHNVDFGPFLFCVMDMWYSYRMAWFYLVGQ